MTSKTEADDRLVIKLPDIRVDMVDKIIERVAKLEVFQTGRTLVHVTREPELGLGGIFLPTGEPHLKLIREEKLLEMVQTVCKFMARKRTEFGGVREFVEVDPPVTLIRTLVARGEWSHIRPLDCLVAWPVMRGDGTVFSGLGYDSGTRCFATAYVPVEIPKRVMRKDVQESIATLDDILRDFPFERAEHKSAWLAGLLTVIARPAISGPVPMLVVDANDRGAGKTLLCDLIGQITSGRELPRRSPPANDEEWGKEMLSIGLGGYPVILLDNVTGTLRSKVLDSILTGNKYEGRLLGRNQDATVSVKSQFLASSNNATLSTDLIRRSIHCRLLVDAERPERRTGFKYRLPEDAAQLEMRKRLLGAAVKILLGYEHAGRPRVNVRPMGSYVAWSERVQKPIVWAGLADPVITQDELREQADPDHEQLEILLDAWYEFFGEETLTLGNALTRVRESSTGSDANRKACHLQAALETLSEIPGHPITAARVGYKIRSWRERWVSGKAFCWGTHEGGARRWRVQLKRA